jgi:poly-gamma-glutamate synthesis protein (capsule biosynthesis protein)
MNLTVTVCGYSSKVALAVTFLFLVMVALVEVPQHPPKHRRESAQQSRRTDLITLFLSGDVMTGRGIDQILPHPSDPVIHEGYMKDARGYVEIAEKVNGPIPRSVAPGYIWGDALDELERVAPDLRIVNLETAVTRSDDYWKGKEIHYRMHPGNIDCITAAKIDICALANNHILDWGYTGLKETLETLKKAKIRSVGQG